MLFRSGHVVRVEQSLLLGHRGLGPILIHLRPHHLRVQPQLPTEKDDARDDGQIREQRQPLGEGQSSTPRRYTQDRGEGRSSRGGVLRGPSQLLPDRPLEFPIRLQQTFSHQDGDRRRSTDLEGLSVELQVRPYR